MSRRKSNFGFTFIELIVVIVIVGILSALLLPRYWEVSRQARIATLDGVVGAMRSAIGITKAKALSQGIRINPSNPGNAEQFINIVEMEGLRVEVDWRNLCPESEPELGSAVTDSTISMLDFIMMKRNTDGSLGDLLTYVDNQFTQIGYVLPTASDRSGCYVEYDSFGNNPPLPPTCPITMVIDKC